MRVVKPSNRLEVILFISWAIVLIGGMLLIGFVNGW
jgi:hypothetical protein